MDAAGVPDQLRALCLRGGEGDEDGGAGSAPAAAVAHASSRRVSAPRGVATPGIVSRKSFVRPGGVGAAWARCVGAQKTVSVGRKRAAEAEPGAEPSALPLQPLAVAPAATLQPRSLADLAVFLRHRKRRFVSEAAKLMGPQPPLAPGERCSLINLPVELLMKIVCSLRHDELRPLLATCTRLRQAASAAIAVHFNYCTPEPQRDEHDAVLGALRSPSPRFIHAALALATDGPAAPRRNRTRRRRPPRPPPPAATLALGWHPDGGAGAGGDAATPPGPAASMGFASPPPQSAAEGSPTAQAGSPGGADAASRPMGQRLSFAEDFGL